MSQLTIRIDDELKGHLQSLARQQGKSTSDVVRRLIERYVRDRDRGAALRALWNQMQSNAMAAGAGPGDVDEAIQAVREAREDQGENRPGGAPAEERS